MNWNNLEKASQLEAINEESKNIPVMLFNHSTRCSISDMAINRIQSNWKDTDNQHIKPYYLDLIAHRDISNLIAQQYGIEHQSPQVLIISNGECIYHESHTNIRYNDVMKLGK
jgi:bacillithiol system protein YtxJ